MTVRNMVGVVFAAVLVAAGGVVTPAVAAAAEPPTQISSDPFTNPTSQHKTQVEPDTFSFGRTEVAAVQSGRFFDGGSSDVGWSTSKDGGSQWTHGFLPGTTTAAHPAGPYARVSDPSVAYDARHHSWMISTVALTDTPNGPFGAAVLLSLIHISEPTRRTPISYAVFCLKKTT